MLIGTTNIVILGDSVYLQMFARGPIPDQSRGSGNEPPPKRQANSGYYGPYRGLLNPLNRAKAAAALHFAHYNFCRIHGSLRVTPAMAAGLASEIWDVADLLAT